MGAKKESVNPHFKSKYADLSSVIDACRKPLGDNGLAFVQLVSTDKSGVIVTTRLLHSSGESIEASCWLPVVQQTPQAYGSAITYGRRYSLAAMVGVAAEDDDGNGATSAGKEAMVPAGVEKLREQIAGALGKVRTHEDIKMGNFGTGAGLPMSELDDKSLAFYRGACTKNLADETKAQWHGKEILRLAAFNAEMLYRGLTP